MTTDLVWSICGAIIVVMLAFFIMKGIFGDD